MTRDPQAHQRPENVPNRRAFFRGMLDEGRALGEELCGRPQLKLGDLEDLPDEKLAHVMPMVNPDYEIAIDGGEVTARERKTGAVIRLFPLDSDETAAFNMFDGMTPLADVARRLAVSLESEEDVAFCRAKRLFISLMKKSVCVPSNSVW